jgi:hypothetical protein
MTRFLLVSGLPASGKSTLARLLAGRLALPLLDKDDFLEALFAEGLPSEPAARRQLSRQADVAFQQAVESSSGAVAASWWQHPRSASDSGTPIEWLARLPGELIEAHCRCSPALAASRFLERRRHPGHLDERWSLAELIAQFERHAALGSLGLGRVVDVDTEGPVDADSVLRQMGF